MVKRLSDYWRVLDLRISENIGRANNQMSVFSRTRIKSSLLKTLVSGRGLKIVADNRVAIIESPIIESPIIESPIIESPIISRPIIGHYLYW